MSGLLPGIHQRRVILQQPGVNVLEQILGHRQHRFGLRVADCSGDVVDAHTPFFSVTVELFNQWFVESDGERQGADDAEVMRIPLRDVVAGGDQSRRPSLQRGVVGDVEPPVIVKPFDSSSPWLKSHGRCLPHRAGLECHSLSP